MLDFKPVTLEHKDLIEKYYTQKNRFICDYSPVDIIIWAHNYRTKICEEDGFLFYGSRCTKYCIFYAPYFHWR